MNIKLLVSSAFLLLLQAINAQTVTVFNNVPFYSMYHYLNEGETLPPEAYSQIPTGAIRLHAYEREIISRKLSAEEIASLGSNVQINVSLIAACDNYDRLAGINLALVPKGSTTYTWGQSDVKRIELGRFITPFMNKNVSPTSVPYRFRTDQLSAIVHQPALAAMYDFWIEFRADGYSAAANTQVAGCAGRTDVFRGSLELVSSGTAESTSSVFLPIFYRENFNNYSATDVPGQTTKSVSFTLDEPVNDAVLYLITSNHGADGDGEEYNRRQHFVYLDGQLIHQYKPGGKSCEPYRMYNTQGNGIYGSTAKTIRNWMSWNNWCPGDAIPNREVKLGSLSAGTHTMKLDVPDAVFSEGKGNFPVSMYLMNAASGQAICAAPTDLHIISQENTSVKFGWTENGNSSNWEALWGRKNSFGTVYDVYKPESAIPESTRNDLNVAWFYEMFVKSKCTAGSESEWVGPVYSNRIVLATDEVRKTAVQIYPNPAKDVLHIKAPIAVKNSVLHSAEGKKLLEKSIDIINISSYPKGVYFLSIELVDGTVVFQKVIKE